MYSSRYRFSVHFGLRLPTNVRIAFSSKRCLDVSIRRRQTGHFHMELWTKNRGPGGEDWESETWGGLFFLPSLFFFGPSWHRNGLVGRKRESGGKTNDENVYSIPVPSLNTWKEPERHIWIQSASLWWHQVFFSQIRGLEATGCLWQLGVDSCHLNTWTTPPPPTLQSN